MCIQDDCPAHDRRTFLSAGAALLALGAAAPGLADPDPLQGEILRFPSAVGDVDAYLSLPAAGVRAPAILLMHGEIGLPLGHRLIADELARADFCALVVSSFSRLPGFGWDDVRKDDEGPKHFLSETFFHEQEQEALGAIAWLKRHPRVRPGKFGAVGFCGGGVRAARLSIDSPDLGAVVSFYGPPVLTEKYRNPTDPMPDLVTLGPRIHTPLQIHYGTADYIVKAADVDRLAAAVRSNGTEVQVFAYEGATHAFYDRTNAQAWDEARGALARERYIGFLRTHLG